MDDTEASSLEQIRAFLAGSGEVRFAGQRREEVYTWVETTLVRLEYARLDKPGKGLVRRYICRMTGLSRAQVTRLIARQRRTGRVQAAAYQRTKFATRYTAADVTLLAYVDKAHGNLSGPATKRIIERASARRNPANLTSPLPAKNPRICSRLSASESSMLMSNSQHPDPRPL